MILRKIAGLWERYQNLNLKIALVLISLQIIHLYWLTTTVVIRRLFEENFFAFPQVPTILFVAIDYLEIPALFAGMMFYALLLYREKRNPWRNVVFLSLLAVQIFHIFWITDEVVYQTLFNTIPIALPPLVAWAAIFVDYLELPVIWDLLYKLMTGKRG